MERKLKTIFNYKLFILLGIIIFLPICSVQAARTGAVSTGYRINSDEGDAVVSQGTCKRVYDMNNVVMDGLIAWFPFEGDAHNYANDNNTVSLSYGSYVTGRNGLGLSLTGGTLTLSNFDDHTLGQIPFSTSFWFFNTYCGSTGYFIRLGDGGGLYCSNVAPYPTYFSGSSFSLGVRDYLIFNDWNHVAFVYDGTTATLYVNNSVVGTTSSGFFVTGDGSLVFAGRSGNPIFDDLGLWRRALTAAEVAQMYNRTATGKHYFVPSKTATEWNAFLAHMPSGVVARECYCAAGYYRSSASDACVVTPAGYYSPANDPRLYDCGSSAYYCPGGTDRNVIGAGYRAYTYIEYNYASQTIDSRASCQSGYYCTGDGNRNAVSSGYYGDPAGNYATGQAICPFGYTCSSGVSTIVPAGYYGFSGLASCTVDGTGCNTTATVPQYYYSTLGSGKLPCPAGVYSTQTGRTTAACSGYCTAGYYCNAGSNTATQNQCPAGSYCPTGSGSPISCGAGKTSPVRSTSVAACVAIRNQCYDIASQYRWGCRDNGLTAVANPARTSTQTTAAACQTYCTSYTEQSYCCTWNSTTKVCSTVIPTYGGPITEYYLGSGSSYSGICWLY